MGNFKEVVEYWVLQLDYFVETEVEIVWNIVFKFYQDRYVRFILIKRYYSLQPLILLSILERSLVGLRASCRACV